MLLGLKLEQWLAFGVVAAIISTAGSLLGTVLKDYFFARSLETWRQRKTLEQVYQRFRDPLLLSARELCSRLIEILDQYPTCYLKTSVLELRAGRQMTNSADDPYFRRYKLVSTAYRLCSFLGWLELYRQEVVFLRSGNNKHTKQLEDTISKIRSDLADGQLNTAEDWPVWKDTLVFREELRAIGESMIETRTAPKVIMGYGRFCEVFDSQVSTGANRWIAVVLNFMLDQETNQRDFRKTRLARLVVHLVDLLKLLDDANLGKHFSEARTRWTQLSSC